MSVILYPICTFAQIINHSLAEVWMKLAVFPRGRSELVKRVNKSLLMAEPLLLGFLIGKPFCFYKSLTKAAEKEIDGVIEILIECCVSHMIINPQHGVLTCCLEILAKALTPVGLVLNG